MAENRGAGEGNRTLVVSLGSFCSTIELHPRAKSHLFKRGGFGKRPVAEILSVFSR